MITEAYRHKVLIEVGRNGLGFSPRLFSGWWFSVAAALPVLFFFVLFGFGKSSFHESLQVAWVFAELPLVSAALLGFILRRTDDVSIGGDLCRVVDCAYWFRRRSTSFCACATGGFQGSRRRFRRGRPIPGNYLLFARACCLTGKLPGAFPVWILITLTQWFRVDWFPAG